LINNRQNGRRRGRGGNGVPRPNGNGGDRGNRIDNRARGNASQLHEKYKTLARDAQMQGDRVTAEYYLQFADHYFRVLSESRARFEDQRRDRNEGDSFDDEIEGEEGDERYEDASFERQPQSQPQPQRREERADNRQDERGPRREERGERRRFRDDRDTRDNRDARERAPRQSEAQPQLAIEDEPQAEAAGDRVPLSNSGPDGQDAGQEVRPARRTRARRAPADEESGSRIEVASLPPALTAAPSETSEEGHVAAEDAPKRRRIRKPRVDVAEAEL
jgi:hypothetical protein